MQSLLSSVHYDTLLTPQDLLKYVTNPDFIHNDTTTELTLAKQDTKGIVRVIRIPLLPPSTLPEKQDYHLEIDIALSDPGTEDADITFILSDNVHFVGVVVPDMMDQRATLCYGLEGQDIFPRGIQNRRRASLTEINKRFEMPIDSRQAVKRVQLLFKPYQHWGACVVTGAHEFINTLEYENIVDTSRALFLDVYLDDEEEVHSLLYINAKLVLKDDLR